MSVLETRGYLLPSKNAYFQSHLYTKLKIKRNSLASMYLNMNGKDQSSLEFKLPVVSTSLIDAY